ncbi:MAG: Holliday junction branch migration protein RuvA [Microgenomates group bacterium]|nr:Holliday junction branch migration protein RuvA [Microgenomates group bacterium]
MIGKIKGKLIEINNNVGLIETNSGVSFEVYLTPFLLSNHKKNELIEIFTYLQVREDALVLFGFANQKENNFFKLLLNVPGVGPKIAYSVISYGNIDEIFAAVKKNDIDYFTKIPGLGKKTAMKIILELSQKIKSEFILQDMYLSEDDKIVVDALVALGYKSSQARSLLKKIPKNLSIEDKIKFALKNKLS